MSERQTELKMFVSAPDDVNVRWLEDLLNSAGCWMTARDIALTVGGARLDRDLREYASASRRIISGQKGYKHITHATAAEFNHAAGWMESQAKKMSDRACAIRAEAHKLFG